MSQQRKHYTAEEKVAILRRHLLDKVPVGEEVESWRGTKPPLIVPNSTLLLPTTVTSIRAASGAFIPERSATYQTRAGRFSGHHSTIRRSSPDLESITWPE